MNAPPVRFKDSEDADGFLRNLLEAGRPTSPLPHSARLRGERRVGKLAAAPAVVIGAALWSKVVAAFGVGFAGALALVSVSPALREKLTPRPAGAGRSVEPRASASPAASSVIAPPSEAPRETSPASATPLEATTPSGPPRIRPPVKPGVPPSTVVQQAPKVAANEPVSLAGLEAPGAASERATPPNGTSADSMSAEVRLLTLARALVSSDPNQALILLNRHAVEFPKAALAMEREMLVIEALEHTGRAKQAKERARELLAGSPAAFYAARLERLIEEP